MGEDQHAYRKKFLKIIPIYKEIIQLPCSSGLIPNLELNNIFWKIRFYYFQVLRVYQKENCVSNDCLFIVCLNQFYKKVNIQLKFTKNLLVKKLESGRNFLNMENNYWTKWQHYTIGSTRGTLPKCIWPTDLHLCIY